MSTFKTALRMALAHPFYLLIYTVFISLMGVFIAASVSWNSSQLTEYKPYDTNVIVVDRDNSDLSRIPCPGPTDLARLARYREASAYLQALA